MTPAHCLTLEIFGRFIDGQLKTKSPSAATRRGEIKKIIVDGQKVRVCLSWSAVKFDGAWYVDSISEHALNLRRCQFREDTGADAGVLRIDCPYSGRAITFYPAGHKKNVRQSDILPKPTK